MEITVTPTRNGMLELTTIYNGEYYRQRYEGYSRSEAKQIFKQYVVGEDAKIFRHVGSHETHENSPRSPGRQSRIVLCLDRSGRLVAWGLVADHTWEGAERRVNDVLNSVAHTLSANVHEVLAQGSLRFKEVAAKLPLIQLASVERIV